MLFNEFTLESVSIESFSYLDEYDFDVTTESFTDALKGICGFIKTLFQKLINAIKTFWTKIINTTTEKTRKVKDDLEDINVREIINTYGREKFLDELMGKLNTKARISNAGSKLVAKKQTTSDALTNLSDNLLDSMLGGYNYLVSGFDVNPEEYIRFSTNPVYEEVDFKGGIKSSIDDILRFLSYSSKDTSEINNEITKYFNNMKKYLDDECVKVKNYIDKFISSKTFHKDMDNESQKKSGMYYGGAFDDIHAERDAKKNAILENKELVNAIKVRGSNYEKDLIAKGSMYLKCMDSALSYITSFAKSHNIKEANSNTQQENDKK